MKKIVNKIDKSPYTVCCQPLLSNFHSFKTPVRRKILMSAVGLRQEAEFLRRLHCSVKSKYYEVVISVLVTWGWKSSIYFFYKSIQHMDRLLYC